MSSLELPLALASMPRSGFPNARRYALQSCLGRHCDRNCNCADVLVGNHPSTYCSAHENLQDHLQRLRLQRYHLRLGSYFSAYQKTRVAAAATTAIASEEPQLGNCLAMAFKHQPTPLGPPVVQSAHISSHYLERTRIYSTAALLESSDSTMSCHLRVSPRSIQNTYVPGSGSLRSYNVSFKTGATRDIVD